LKDTGPCGASPNLVRGHCDMVQWALRSLVFRET